MEIKMKTKALKYLDGLVTDNTTKVEYDLIAYCKKCVRAYTEPEKKKEEFTPPTLEEVRAYVKEKNYNLDVEKFHRYYTESNWRDARGKQVKNWKLKLMVWDRPKHSNFADSRKFADNGKEAKKREYTKVEMDSFFDDIDDVEI
jgi:hypothetical protein